MVYLQTKEACDHQKNLKKHYFMSSTCMQTGLPCVRNCEHWKWFQDHSFDEISSSWSLLKLTIFSFFKNSFSYFLQIKTWKYLFSSKNLFYCFANNFWSRFFWDLKFWWHNVYSIILIIHIFLIFKHVFSKGHYY